MEAKTIPLKGSLNELEETASKSIASIDTPPVRQELTEIRRLVARDLADAAIPALSEDRRFATAYNAAL